jgi:hypothetical protein
MITRSRSARLAVLGLFTVVMTACGGSSSTPPAPTTVTTTTPDAVGDATASGGGTAWDITQVVTSRAISGATSLSISVTFAQAISAANLPAPGAGIATPTQLGAAIIFATGGAGTSSGALTGCTGTPTFSNLTYILDPAAFFSPRLADGNFAIANTVASTISGEASIAFTGPNTLTYTVPLSAIGGGSGAVQIAAVALNGAAGFGASTPSLTDCTPNASYIST